MKRNNKFKKTSDVKNFYASYMGRINNMTVAILLKAIYRLNEMPLKILIYFFEEIEKSILKFIWKDKRLQKQKLP
jgi:hypothetical protein